MQEKLSLEERPLSPELPANSGIRLDMGELLIRAGQEAEQKKEMTRNEMALQEAIDAKACLETLESPASQHARLDMGEFLDEYEPRS